MLYKNDPPGRTIMDCANLTYDYPNGVKMSFTQNVFHPRNMPNNNQYIYVYGSQGAVDLLYQANLYPLSAAPGQASPPSQLAQKQPESQHAHITAFYDCITKGGPNPADITIGASAALTSILGHEAMVKEKVVRWSDLGVDL
jgi:hypothetical protein